MIPCALFFSYRSAKSNADELWWFCTLRFRPRVYHWRLGSCFFTRISRQNEKATTKLCFKTNPESVFLKGLSASILAIPKRNSRCAVPCFALPFASWSKLPKDKQFLIALIMVAKDERHKQDQGLWGSYAFLLSWPIEPFHTTNSVTKMVQMVPLLQIRNFDRCWCRSPM